MTPSSEAQRATAELFSRDKGVYLLSHSIGKMPMSAVQFANQHFFRIWQGQPADAWPMWLGAIDAFNNSLAQLLNGAAESFCPQSNLSSGLSKVLGALPPKSGKKVIVCTENDFPSAGFVLQQAKKIGFELRMISKAEDVLDLDVWEQALQNDVHTVFITHVHYNTNKRVAVKEICEIARANGISSIVDIAQSAGIVPIDLNEWRADAVLGSCIKWLCGGPGAGFLWIAPEFLDTLTPVDVGWFSHRNPFEFDINNFEYATSSAKFWGGTPSILPYVVATNSIQTMCEIGIDKIRAHNKRLAKKLIEHVHPQSVVSPTVPGLQGGTTVLKFHDQLKVELALRHACIKFDAREQGIRLSPHIYNSEAEIDLVLDCLPGY